MAKSKKVCGDEYMQFIRSLTDKELSSLKQAVERGLFDVVRHAFWLRERQIKIKPDLFQFHAGGEPRPL